MRWSLLVLPLVACDRAVDPVADPPVVDVTTPAPPDETVPPAPDPVATSTWQSVPILGGTMAATDRLVVAADPTRDLLTFHVAGSDAVSTTQLAAGSQPFRVLIDGDRAYVTLRGAGQVAMFDDEGNEIGRRTVCRHPRGLDLYRSLHIACAGGEIVDLDPDTLAITDRTYVGPDLRDVVARDEVLYVSRFRAAEVLRVDVNTKFVRAISRPNLQRAERFDASARVAWRMVGHPDGGVLMLHQAHSDEPIDLEFPEDEVDKPEEQRSPYGHPEPQGCDDFPRPGDKTGEEPPARLVTSHLTHIRANGSVITGGRLHLIVAPTDVAARPGSYVVVGRDGVADSDRSVIHVYQPAMAEAPDCVMPTSRRQNIGVVTSVAQNRDTTYAYDRERGEFFHESRLFHVDGPHTLAPDSLNVRVFHDAPGAGISCASCHPEAQDDGHVWRFETLGPRRTQNLAGGLTERGRFHWDAEFDSLAGLMDDVFTTRMAGRTLADGTIDDLGAWLDGVGPVSAQSDAGADALARGKELFERSAVGCTGCHTGPQLTDHRLYRVRTGGELRKTPSLRGVGTRAPYMSDGCAPTLLDRFTDVACGGDLHGSVASLEASDIEALAAYVSTL